MKTAVILTIVVTAGITFPVAFFAGAFLTKPARDELAKQKIYFELQINRLNDEKNSLLSHINNATSAINKAADQLKKNTHYIKKLESENTQLKTPSEALDSVSSSSDFIVKNIHIINDDHRNIIIGEIVNESKKDYQMCNFTCSIYGLEDELLDSVPILIGSFSKNQTQTFDTSSVNSLGKAIDHINVTFHSGL